MALAKHLEEIEERKIENTSASYEARISNYLPDPSPLPAAPSGDVYLTRGGRRMEDVEVFEAGNTFELCVVNTKGAIPPEVEFENGNKLCRLEITSTDRVSVPFNTPGTRRLQVSSGGYVKAYSIEVVEPFKIDQLPDFAKLIKSLAETPPRWTPKTFDQFRNEIEGILREAKVPELFVTGIVEYHLGLFQQEQQIPEFRERLQTAYGSLRWFTPYSDVSRLICGYYLFCANEFAAAETLFPSKRGRLSNSLSFYLGRSATDSASFSHSGCSKASLPLLLAKSDVLTFQAIEALHGHRADDARELVMVIRRDITPSFDKERAERVDFLEACTFEQCGDTQAAKRGFEALMHSPYQSIASAAAIHLKNINHG